MKDNAWKESINNSISRLNVEQKRLDDLRISINNALVEILQYDISEMRKIRYDFLKGVPKTGLSNAIYQSYCLKSINTFVNSRRDVYKEAFINYKFDHHEPIVDDIYFKLGDYNYIISDFLDQASKAYANEFIPRIVG